MSQAHEAYPTVFSASQVRSYHLSQVFREWLSLFAAKLPITADALSRGEVPEPPEPQLESPTEEGSEAEALLDQELDDYLGKGISNAPPPNK